MKRQALRHEVDHLSLLTHGNIVETVKVRQRLRVVLVLDQLFRSTVQKTDVRVGTQDLLAVELEDETKHTVCGGMLRAKVDWKRRILRSACAPSPRSGASSPSSPVKCLMLASFRDPVSFKISSAVKLCSSSTEWLRTGGRVSIASLPVCIGDGVASPRAATTCGRNLEAPAALDTSGRRLRNIVS